MGESHQAATVAAAFIVLNSISGLLGRLTAGIFAFDTFSISLIPFGIIGAQRISNLNLRRTLGVVMSFAVTNFWLTFWR